MKKLLKLGEALKKAEQKDIFGGDRTLLYEAEWECQSQEGSRCDTDMDCECYNPDSKCINVVTQGSFSGGGTTVLYPDNDTRICSTV